MELSDDEWRDLSEMVDHFRTCTEWVTSPRQSADDPHITMLRRKRDLAEKIIQMTS